MIKQGVSRELSCHVVIVLTTGGHLVAGDHGDGDGGRGAALLQRAAAAGDAPHPRHAAAQTQKHPQSQYFSYSCAAREQTIMSVVRTHCLSKRLDVQITWAEC